MEKYKALETFCGLVLIFKNFPAEDFPITDYWVKICGRALSGESDSLKPYLWWAH